MGAGNTTRPSRATAQNATKTPTTLDRVGALISRSVGLGATLHSINYGAWLLSDTLEVSAPIVRQVCQRLGFSVSTEVFSAGSYRCAALADLLWDTRAVLRLVGLVPLSLKFRTLCSGPKHGEDRILHTTALLHTACYSLFHATEHVALLTQYHVLPHSILPAVDVSQVYLWAYRWRSAALLCTLFEIARKGWLIRKRRATRKSQNETEDELNDAAEDKQWFYELFVAATFLPIAIPYLTSSVMPDFSNALQGACGLMAGLPKLYTLWKSTASA